MIKAEELKTLSCSWENLFFMRFRFNIQSSKIIHARGSNWWRGCLCPTCFQKTPLVLCPHSSFCLRKRHDNPLLEHGVCHLFPKHMPIIPTHKWSALLTECCHRLSPRWAVGWMCHCLRFAKRWADELEERGFGAWRGGVVGTGPRRAPTWSPCRYLVPAPMGSWSSRGDSALIS